MIKTTQTTTLSDFTCLDATGKDRIALKEYAEKVVLIVNTASQCGFTPQYQDLQTLYERYQHRGFIILAFPCNQFGDQEPKSSEEIFNFCTNQFLIDFPIMAKIEVNGDNTDPLYQWLKVKQPGIFGTQSIKWNFTKFLINRQGIPIKRYPTIMNPMADRIIKDVERLL